jgi:hypothetical protein
MSNQAFCLDHTAKHNHHHHEKRSMYSSESVYVNDESHLYDKLSYPSSVNAKPTRRFINSTQGDCDNDNNHDQDENATATYSNGIDFTQTESCHSFSQNQHIYEDITNFSAVIKLPKSDEANYGQLEQFSARSSRVKNLNSHETSLLTNISIVESYKPRKNVYKREYTVNEIFQNVKKFKEQAAEQETLSNTLEPPFVKSVLQKPAGVNTKTEEVPANNKNKQVSSNVSQFLTSEQMKSSVSIIKQIFEMKSNHSNKSVNTTAKKSSDRTLIVPTAESVKSNNTDARTVVKPAVRLRPRQHTYVNEKLLQPIDV